MKNSKSQRFAFVAYVAFIVLLFVAFAVNQANADEPLYGLVVNSCDGELCDSYIIDKDFTLEDCKEAATLRALDKAPAITWACVELDVE